MPLDAVQATNTGATNEERLAATWEIQRIDRRRDELSGERRAAIKRWTAAGVPMKAVLATIRAGKLDPETVDAELRDYVHMLALRHIMDLAKFGKQVSMMDDQTSPAAQQKDAEVAADNAGYKAGRDGVAIDDSPYIAGTEADMIWRKAWGDGRTAADVAAGPNATMADASRERPERDEDAEAADNVVEMTGQLTGGVPNPKKKDKGKAEKKGGKGKNAPKSAPGRKGPARKAAAASKPATNGKGTHAPQRLLLTDEAAPRKRGRPSNAEIARRRAVAEEAGRGDLAAG